MNKKKKWKKEAFVHKTEIKIEEEKKKRKIATRKFRTQKKNVRGSKLKKKVELDSCVYREAYKFLFHPRFSSN